MKFEKSNFSALMFMLIALYGFAPLCYAETSSDKTSIEEVKQETQDLLQTLNAYTVDQKDEAIHKTKAALDIWISASMHWKHVSMKAGTKWIRPPAKRHVLASKRYASSGLR